MEVVEAAEKEVENSNVSLTRLKASRGDQFQVLTDESEIIRKDLERLSSERSAVVTDLAAQALSDYEQLRKQRRGLAVTTVSDNACSACGTTLTPSQEQSAHSTSQLFHCPSCGRILYAN
jgi:Zn-ribbon protein, possibly nucleic acid-binding